MMELWQHYKNSIFLCHQRLATHLSFAIVSAQNPAGVNAPAVYNRLLDKQLQAQLQQTGLAYRSVIGSAPDRSFEERSWMVLCDKVQAIALGRLFTQNAIFWVDKNELYLVPVLMQQPEEHLGGFANRLVLLPA
ncbi:DUF3293 domain-containing protein [Alishewanella sp. 16-MA]|uniref:DUF3293 domain-containing protein n=1 Tax=Alishewanella maricola TaxID=2795740 RepID=A0ABS8C7A5_9ALTE|nr:MULTISPECIES: DUF3293 domain-containing protein [Gammaproteobacteria]MCB5228228.1 DUF3293 domain-containing protein [Alishewanella maricola]